MKQVSVYVVMGVSGCGKSTLGAALAARLDVPFFDGDDFHPPDNVRKMSAGIPLDDTDREPWLARLHALIGEQLASGQGAVVACSALKQRYRDQLRGDLAGVVFVYLHGRFTTIYQRMQSRPGHFMAADMLQSQFDALEEPSAQEAIRVDVEQPVDELVTRIVAQSAAARSQKDTK